MAEITLELDLFRFINDADALVEQKAKVKLLSDFPLPGRPYALEILPPDGDEWVIPMNSLEARALLRALERTLNDDPES